MPALPLLPYIKVKDDIIYEISYSFSDLTGYLRKELVNSTIESVFGKLFKKSIDFSRFYDGMEREIYLITKSCQVRLVHMISFRGYSPDEMVVIFIEIPNSRIEDKLTFVEQISRVDGIGIAILSLPDIILLEANQSFLHLFKSPYNTKVNCIGVPLDKIARDWLDKDGNFLWEEALTSGTVKRVKEFRVEQEGHKEVFLDIVFLPIEEGGISKYIMCSTFDITDRVIDRQLIEARSIVIQNQIDEIEKVLKAKDEFFNFISHEFKVPLTVINAAVQTIENIYRDEVPDKVKKLVYQIKQNSYRQLRLVNNLLEITKAEGGYIKIHKRNMDIVSVTKSIVASVKLYASEKGVDIGINSCFNQKIIGIDEEKYERVILNLLSNAIKFTPRGKSIRVEISSVDDRVCIRVKDEGEGIPEDKLDLIFNRFVQADNSLVRERMGTGLGLTLVKLLVNTMDGKIYVKSKVGEGSTFTVMLPADKAEADENNYRHATSNIADNNLIYAAAIEFSDIYSQDFQGKTHNVSSLDQN